MNQTQIQSQKLIPGKTVCRIVGFQRTKLNCLVKEKKFPQPIRLSQTFVLWHVAEVTPWIEDQKEARAKCGGIWANKENQLNF